MKAAATEVYRFHVEGQTLTLHQVRDVRRLSKPGQHAEVHSRGIAARLLRLTNRAITRSRNGDWAKV